MRQKIGKAIPVAICIIVAAGLLALMQLPIEAQPSPNRRTYRALRTVTATEDTQLTASTQSTAPSASNDGTVSVFISESVGSIQIRFKGTAAADKTLAWTLWAYKNSSSPARYVAYGTATTGLTQTGETNEFYCDTIVITDQQWTKTAAISNGAPDAVISNGGIAELTVDTVEYTIWKIVIRDIAAGGAEMATAGADYCTFN